MIVVSNTSPLNYLILIDAIDVLPRLYQRIFVPLTVVSELGHAGSPSPVRHWVASPPAWLVVRTPKNMSPLTGLHAGEAEAIALAQELNADRILIDERRGREVSKTVGLNPVGILGVLYEAAGEKIIDLPTSLERLTKTPTSIATKESSGKS